MKSYFILSLLISCTLLWSAGTPGGLENALDISTSGVIAQNKKVQVIAQNIANIDSVKTDSGTPYNRKVVILKPAEYFSGGDINRNILNGVKVDSVQEVKGKYNKVYDPNHPQADKNGYVYYPNVDMTKELLEMTRASDAFETNVIVFNTTKGMMQSSLEIGK